MKKLFSLLVVMFIIYLGIQLGFIYFSKGHYISYNVNGYTINETFSSNDVDGYYIEILVNDKVFNFQTISNFNKASEIVNDVKYIKTKDYECVYPSFKNGKAVTDILCMKNSVIYNYQTIMGKDNELDNLVKSIYNYNVLTYSDISALDDIESGISVYKDNIVKNHYFGFFDQKGVNLINNFSENKYYYTVDIFPTEIENSIISLYDDRYYIIADYQENYSFKNFHIIDIVLGTTNKISYNRTISFNSYIMGTINKNIYLYNMDNKIQYEINYETNSIIEIGNSSLGIRMYTNGKWETLPASYLKNKPVFVISKDYKSGYQMIDIVGDKDLGYKYYYKNNGNGYDVYRSSIVNDNILTYLFRTSMINVKYVKDYVYYQDGEYIKYYGPYGVKTLCHINSKIYGNVIKYGIYSE